MEGNLALLSLSYDLLFGRKNLLRFLKGKINDAECEPSPLLCILAQLPLKLIITTNYDCLMERALAKFGKDYKVIEQPLEGFGRDASVNKSYKLIDYKGIILYKIHGSFCHQSSSEVNKKLQEKIVITEEDYIQLLTVIKEDIMGLRFIQEKLVSSALLFLGYSLEDWDFRLIYKSLVENLNSDEQEKSFAIMNTASVIWKKYWEKKNVNILEMDIHDFSNTLSEEFGIR